MIKISSQIKGYLKNKRGDVLQFIIVIVAVVALAVNILPSLMTGIGTQGTTAVSTVETIPTKIK